MRGYAVNVHRLIPNDGDERPDVFDGKGILELFTEHIEDAIAEFEGEYDLKIDFTIDSLARPT